MENECSTAVTLPRLELNGALLLVKLLNVVQRACDKREVELVQFWCDPSVVLCWTRVKKLRKRRTIVDENSTAATDGKVRENWRRSLCPFEKTGVDLCGPVNVKERAGRSKIMSKGYIVVFICMVTRAVHLEIVSNMSSERFIAAFRRMVSRRGHCREVFNEDGGNFVGANSI